MYYELYVDSLFLVNVVMNLYLLLLVNQSMFRTATRKRLILGAIVGALVYFLPFFCSGPLWFKTLLGISAGNISMIMVTFQVRNIQAFLKITERLLMYSILMGGTILLICKNISWLEKMLVRIWGILGVGALLYLLFGYLSEQNFQRDSMCKVSLIAEGNRVTVTALIDTGNSLVEPISGKPVSIVEKDILAYLWEEEPQLYRVVPYHSIGKRNGILKGYLVPEIRIEVDGVTKICRDSYIAVCEEYITSDRKNSEEHVKIILNPILLREQYSEELKGHKRKVKMKQRASKERYG